MSTERKITEKETSDTPTSARPNHNMSETPNPETVNDKVPEASNENVPEIPKDNVQQSPNGKMLEQPIEAEQVDEFDGFDDDDYEPDFIKDWLRNPPLLPGEDQGEFEQMFESFALFHNGRPKTVAEYMMVKQATTITWEIMRHERFKVKILIYEGRFAVEAIYRKTYENLATDGEPKEFKSSAKKWTEHYFTNPEYRKAYAAKLESGGYGAGAIEVEAFQRSLYSLSQLDRLIANLEKRLFDILKRLDQIYAGRHPNMNIHTAHEPYLPDEE